MNKTQRWNYEDLQTSCDQIAAMGKVLVDFADGTLCNSDPEHVQDSDIQRAEAILTRLKEIFADEHLQAHCRKIGIDTTEDWAEVYQRLPELLQQTNQGA